MRRTQKSELAAGCAVVGVAAAVTLSAPGVSTVSLLALVTGCVTFPLWKRWVSSSVESAPGEEDLSHFEQQRHTLLLESIHHLPMPYALYDESDRLCVWNEHYESIYAKVFSQLNGIDEAKNLTYGDMLRLNSDGKLSGKELDDYIDERVKAQRKEDGNIVDRCYPELGWYRVSKYSTPSGGVAGFAIDINELKSREDDLMQEIERRKKLEVEVRKIANTDQLTGIPNRRHFMEMAEHGFDNATGDKGARLFLLMLDIDHFKNINDSYGHVCGDEVIRAVATVVSNVLSSEHCHVGRVGGEEFAAALNGLTRTQVQDLAIQTQEAIGRLTFSTEGSEFSTSASIGVSECWDSDTSVMKAIQRADQALYQAKEQGRDCVRMCAQSEVDQLRKAG